MKFTSQMFTLINNEMIKHLYRLRTLVLIIIIIIFTLLFLRHDAGQDRRSWKQITEEKISIMEQAHESGYELTKLKACLEKNIPCNTWGNWKYAKAVLDNAGVLVIFMIAQASSIISDEYRNGTIYQLFVSPFRRWKLWLAKYITIVIQSFLFLVVMLGTSLLAGAIFIDGQAQDYKDVIIENGNLVEVNLIVQILQLSMTNLIYIIFVATISFMLSCIFKKSAIAIISSMLVWISGAVSVLLLSKYAWFKYTFIPHLKLDQYMLGGKKILADGTLWVSLCVITLYLALFIVIALYSFCERDPVTAD